MEIENVPNSSIIESKEMTTMVLFSVSSNN